MWTSCILAVEFEGIKISKLHKNIRVIFNPKYINNILMNSDLLISTAGLISFEAAYCKIPSLLFQINKNLIVCICAKYNNW